MCIVFFVVCGTGPGHVTVTLASNRDEFFSRATRSLTLSRKRGALSGQDLQRGGAGTWLGTSYGNVFAGTRLAFLTNVRVPTLRSDARSRGDVCATFLAGGESVDDFTARLVRDAVEYDAFNVVFGDVADGRLVFFTNHGAAPRVEAVALNQHYCITNDSQLVSLWPKAVRGLALFRELVATRADDDEQLANALFDKLLSDTQKYEVDQLPVTGVDPAVELALSSIHVPECLLAGNAYGTVSSCVLTMDSAGVRFMAERLHRRDPAVSPQRIVRRAAKMKLLPTRPVLVRDERTIVVGDVHGCAAELEELLEACERDSARDRVILLGDLVGKGPRDADVVKLCKQERFEAIMGNWDFHVLRVFRGEIERSAASAEIGAAFDALTDDDLRWLDRLPYHISLPHYGILCVHAGVEEKSLEQQSPFAMMNMRTLDADGAPHQAARGNGLVDWAAARRTPPHVVFGHDATRRLQTFDFATGIDTGAVYGGQLTALVLPDRLLVSVQAHRTYSAPQTK
jgi:uncharacterized protein with NRDE domain